MYRVRHSVTIVEKGVEQRLEMGTFVTLAELDDVGRAWLVGNGYVEEVAGEVQKPETPEARTPPIEKRKRK